MSEGEFHGVSSEGISQFFGHHDFDNGGFTVSLVLRGGTESIANLVEGVNGGYFGNLVGR